VHQEVKTAEAAVVDRVRGGQVDSHRDAADDVMHLVRLSITRERGIGSSG